MAWLKKRHETALVSIDLMNLFMPRMVMYQGPCEDVPRMLRSCVRLGERLAVDPAVVAYLDVRTFGMMQPTVARQFFKACGTLNIHVVDVEPSGGKDQVDPVIIEEMLAANELESDIPFLLLSADKGFGPMLDTIRRKRDVYVGLPITGNVSSLTTHATDWDWIHPFGWILAALDDVVTGHPRWDTPFEYEVAYSQIRYLFSMLYPGRRITHWWDFCELKWTDDKALWITERRLKQYIAALQAYGILEKRGSWYKVKNHEVFRAPLLFVQ